ncbi:hypothetical protein V3C99_017094 [Haemonchus contortus]|uniref:Transposase n=1 Tax=Haemonchus contortus TaxID=6289 RepID=A0A7I4Z583_HAECO
MALCRTLEQINDQWDTDSLSRSTSVYLKSWWRFECICGFKMNPGD